MESERKHSKPQEQKTFRSRQGCHISKQWHRAGTADIIWKPSKSKEEAERKAIKLFWVNVEDSFILSSLSKCQSRWNSLDPSENPAGQHSQRTRAKNIAAGYLRKSENKNTHETGDGLGLGHRVCAPGMHVRRKNGKSNARLSLSPTHGVWSMERGCLLVLDEVSHSQRWP